MSQAGFQVASLVVDVPDLPRAPGSLEAAYPPQSLLVVFQEDHYLLAASDQIFCRQLQLIALDNPDRPAIRQCASP
ncbi:unnamed protein product [Clonostachys rosea f. rosea IK726]|uniref:Uncharacterized protein n=1 Tax=Clonostachys rosea f. rosea IK726 TaxID=1349383 RepID=A0ACA9TDB3_BIOOC|nr:unnamed protein product [Clonostachys rosea f. rosea IK726]